MGFVDASIDNHFETVTIIYIKLFKLNLQNICGMFKLAGPLRAVHPATNLPVISLLCSKRSGTAVQLACLDGDVALRVPVETLPTVRAGVAAATLVAWAWSETAGELPQFCWLPGCRAGCGEL